MSVTEAKENVGRLVMSRDPGYKLVREMPAHGPYRIAMVTKGGLVILDGYPGFRVPPSLLDLVT